MVYRQLSTQNRGQRPRSEQKTPSNQKPMLHRQRAMARHLAYMGYWEGDGVDVGGQCLQAWAWVGVGWALGGDSRCWVGTVGIGVHWRAWGVSRAWRWWVSWLGKGS